MTWGPWTDGPDPISDTTTFTAADHTARIYADPNPLFGGNVGLLGWDANWSLLRGVTNDYLDSDPRYQQVWDITRGLDASNSDAGLLYVGGNSAVGSDPWTVTLRREAIEVDLSNTDQYVAMVHRVSSSVFYSIDTLPPGVIGVEIENGGYGTCTGTVTVTWTPPIDPGDPDYALSDIANIGALLLAPFNVPSGGDLNYPYNDLSALSPAPSDSLDFTSSSYVTAMPDALLNYITPPAFLQPTTDWRADDLEFTVSFEMTFPRYRFLYGDVPIRRIYPRRLEGRSIYPPPATQQYGRRTGSSSTL